VGSGESSYALSTVRHVEGASGPTFCLACSLTHYLFSSGSVRRGLPSWGQVWCVWGANGLALYLGPVGFGSAGRGAAQLGEVGRACLAQGANGLGPGAVGRARVRCSLSWFSRLGSAMGANGPAF
jgi:hypothetical protein